MSHAYITASRLETLLLKMNLWLSSSSTKAYAFYTLRQLNDTDQALCHVGHSDTLDYPLLITPASFRLTFVAMGFE